MKYLKMTALLLVFFALAWLKCAAEVSESARTGLKDAALLILPEAAKIALAAILAVNAFMLLFAVIPSRNANPP